MKNSEHYPDPTASQAIGKVDKEQKSVYLHTCKNCGFAVPRTAEDKKKHGYKHMKFECAVADTAAGEYKYLSVAKNCKKFIPKTVEP